MTGVEYSLPLWALLPFSSANSVVLNLGLLKIESHSCQQHMFPDYLLMFPVISSTELVHHLKWLA